MEKDVQQEKESDDIRSVNVIIERQKSNIAQWRIILMCILLVATSFIVTLLRGSKSNPSIIGISSCGAPTWLLFLSFLVVCAVCFVIQVSRCQSEEKLKIRTNMGICKSDVSLQGSSLRSLVLGSLGGGLCSSLGLGGGFIWNPIIIGLGFPP